MSLPDTTSQISLSTPHLDSFMLSARVIYDPNTNERWLLLNANTLSWILGSYGTPTELKTVSGQTKTASGGPLESSQTPG